MSIRACSYSVWAIHAGASRRRLISTPGRGALRRLPVPPDGRQRAQHPVDGAVAHDPGPDHEVRALEHPQPVQEPLGQAGVPQHRRGSAA